jgi:hypothetical protein
MIWLVLVAGSVSAGWLLGQGDAAGNARTALAWAPTDGLVAMLGVTFGLYGRDRVRLRRTYASPSLAFLGKSLFFASLAAAVSWALSPIAWPAPCLHCFAAAGAAGIAVWLGNLPTRL